MNLCEKEKLIFEKISEYDSIVCIAHKNPDFDAIGSNIGLTLALKLNYPEKNIYAIGESGRFVEYDEYKDVIDDEVIKNSLVIVTDTAAKSLIADNRYRLSPYVIKIDHHQNGQNFADLEYLDSGVISAAQIVAQMLINNDFKLNDQIAYLFMMGIIGDSGRFRYRGVNSDTFAVCSELMKYEVNLEPLYKKMYAQSQVVKRYIGYIQANFKVTQNGVAYIKVTEELQRSLDPNLEEIGKGFVNSLSDMPGCPIWTEFTELPEGGIAVELRSSSIKVNDIATSFGGGGHYLAAGAKVNSWDIVDQIIQACDKAIVTANTEND